MSRLDDQLRSEARADDDGVRFDESLHARVMAAIDADAPEVSRRFDPAVIPFLTIAAAVFMIGLSTAGYLLHQSNRPTIGGVPASVALSDLDPTPLLADAADDLAAHFDAARYGYLDEDARALGAFLIDQTSVSVAFGESKDDPA